MRRAFKRSNALKRCTRVHSEVCTRTLHDRRASCRLRRTNSNAAACSLSTPRGAGLSPCTERHSAGQPTPSSEQPGHAGLRNRSRSSAGHLPTTHRRRSRKQVSATRHVGRPSLSVEMLPHVLRAAARRFSTSGFSAERVGPPHACGRRCLCATTGSACGCADRSGLEACRSRAGTRLSSIWARVSSVSTGARQLRQ